VQRADSSSNAVCGRRRSAAALAFVLLAASLAAGAAAQRLGTQPGVGKPPGGIGGGAGIIAPLPPLPPAMQAPTLPAPAVVPRAAPPVAAPAAPAVPAPAAPARVVRFRCEVAPQDQSCREPGASDGGGGDEECSCARDYCHTTAAGNRVCEKLQ